MSTLPETLLAPDIQPRFADDCLDLVDHEVAEMYEVAEALLAITDARRQGSGRATIVKAYNTVRGSAIKHVKAALPALGALVQKYAG